MGHRGLHDGAHVFYRRRTGLGDGERNGGLYFFGGCGPGQINLNHGDLGRFLCGEIVAPGLFILLDRIPALLDE